MPDMFMPVLRRGLAYVTRAGTRVLGNSQAVLFVADVGGPSPVGKEEAQKVGKYLTTDNPL